MPIYDYIQHQQYWGISIQIILKLHPFKIIWIAAENFVGNSTIELLGYLNCNRRYSQISSKYFLDHLPFFFLKNVPVEWSFVNYAKKLRRSALWYILAKVLAKLLVFLWKVFCCFYFVYEWKVAFILLFQIKVICIICFSSAFLKRFKYLKIN